MKGRPAPHKFPRTLKAEAIRERMTDTFYKYFDKIMQPQVDKAIKGDTVAFKAITEHILPKMSDNRNENIQTKVYRLGDDDLNKIKDDLVQLQKSRN